MTVSAQDILNSFDQLSSQEQLEIATAILKRFVNIEISPLNDEDLVLNAEELFLALDQQEAAHESS